MYIASVCTKPVSNYVLKHKDRYDSTKLENAIDGTKLFLELWLIQLKDHKDFQWDKHGVLGKSNDTYAYL